MEYIIRKIKINLNRKAQYNKTPILIYADELIFGIKAKKTCQFKVELMECPEDINLNMYLRVLSPNKEKFKIVPTKVGDGTFLVDLTEEQKNIAGTYKFEVVITNNNGQEMCIYQGQWKIKTWLDNNRDVYINKEVK